MPVSDTISALRHLRISSSEVRWTESDRVEFKIGNQTIPLSLLRDLREGNIGPSINDPALQSALDLDQDNTVPMGISVSLRVPRVVDSLVIAQSIEDLLSLQETQLREPAAYVLLPGGGEGEFFSHIFGQSLDEAGPVIRRYHQALKLWAILQVQKQADLEGSLLFFGIIRRTEIAPGFGIDDLKENIFTEGISAFINDTEGKKTRSTIFNSVLSEFLRDQKPAKAFRYLLHNSEMFDRRLKEGLEIYLAEHSPEKLAEQAQQAGLEFSEKLEKIIGGLEAKSLSIPAAVLLAVKEVAPGAGWTVINLIIAVSAVTYGITMTLVDKSQRALLRVLQTTIAAKRAELQDKGLEDDNPVLKGAFDGLEKRRQWAAIASGWMCFFSWIPVAGVLVAICLGTSKDGASSATASSTTSPTSTTNQTVSSSPYDLTAPAKPPSTNQAVPSIHPAVKP